MPGKSTKSNVASTTPNSKYASVYDFLDQCVVCMDEILCVPSSSQQQSQQQMNAIDVDIEASPGRRSSSKRRTRASLSQPTDGSVVVDRSRVNVAAALGAADGPVFAAASDGSRSAAAETHPIVLLPCGHPLGHYDCAVNWFHHQREDNIRRGLARDSDPNENVFVTTVCPTCRAQAKIDSLTVVNGLACRLAGQDTQRRKPTSSSVYLEKLEKETADFQAKVRTIDDRVVKLYDSVGALEEQLSDVIHRETLHEVACTLRLDDPSTTDLEITEEEKKRRSADILRILVNSGVGVNDETSPSKRELQKFVARIIAGMQAQLQSSGPRTVPVVERRKASRNIVTGQLTDADRLNKRMREIEDCDLGIERLQRKIDDLKHAKEDSSTAAALLKKRTTRNMK